MTHLAFLESTAKELPFPTNRLKMHIPPPPSAALGSIYLDYQQKYE